MENKFCQEKNKKFTKNIKMERKEEIKYFLTKKCAF